MQILDTLRLKKYEQKHPQFSQAIGIFVARLKACTARTPHELRDSFGSCDPVRDPDVGTVYVFNVSGNQLRVIAQISFSNQSVIIHKVLCHQDFDRWSDCIR